MPCCAGIPARTTSIIGDGLQLALTESQLMSLSNTTFTKTLLTAVKSCRPLLGRLKNVRNVEELKCLFKTAPEAHELRILFKYSEAKVNRWIYDGEKSFNRIVRGQPNKPTAQIAFMVNSIRTSFFL